MKTLVLLSRCEAEKMLMHFLGSIRVNPKRVSFLINVSVVCFPPWDSERQKPTITHPLSFGMISSYLEMDFLVLKKMKNHTPQAPHAPQFRKSLSPPLKFVAGVPPEVKVGRMSAKGRSVQTDGRLPAYGGKAQMRV